MIEWNEEGKPPDKQVVEVELDHRIIRVRAIWGRAGTLPHWETEDRSTLYGPSTFRRWRHVKDAPKSTDQPSPWQPERHPDRPQGGTRKSVASVNQRGKRSRRPSYEH